MCSGSQICCISIHINIVTCHNLYSVGLHSSGLSCGAPFPTYFFRV